MTAYIQQLADELKGFDPTRYDDDWKAGIARSQTIQKLAFTCHPRAIPIIVEATRDDLSRWESEALTHWFADQYKAVKTAIITSAKQHGLTGGMYDWFLMDDMFLSQGKVKPEEMYPLIEASLSIENPKAWTVGALAAQHYGNDRFTPRLIALATDPKNKDRVQGIYALALNRTDEGVKTLKDLLNDPDPKVRHEAVQAIDTAYHHRGNSMGRPLKPEDFPSMAGSK